MLRTIRARLTIAFIGLAIGPLILVGAVLAWQGFNVQQEQALELQEEIAQRASGEVGAFIRGLETELRELLQVKDLKNLERDRQRFELSNLQRFEYGFEELAFIDSEGKEQARVSRLVPVIASAFAERSQAEEFVSPVTSGETYYGPVRFHDVTGDPLMTMAVPSLDPRSGLVDGVLVAEIRLKKMWELIGDLRVGDAGIAYVLDEQGRVVAHPNPSVVLRGTRFPVPESSGVQSGLSGGHVVLATSEISLGEEALYVVAERPRAEALAPTIRSGIITLSILVASLGVATVGGFFLVRQIVRPIRELATTAKAISAGDLSKRAEVIGGDELGDLGEAFNTMTAQLRNTIGSLEERTSELETANQSLQIANTVVERVPIGVAVLELEDPDDLGSFRFLVFNPASAEALNMPIESLIGTTISESSPQLLETEVPSAYAKAIRTGEVQELPEVRYGDEKVVTGIYSVVAIQLGRQTVAVLVENITNRRLTEERLKTSFEAKEVLLKEVHHRVKNNLQVISSLLNLQSRNIENERARNILKESRNRVRTMALIHEQLYRSQDPTRIPFGVYIRKLTGDLYHTYQVDSDQVTVNITAGPVPVGIDAAIPCGLIINELVSNSLKHAFPEGAPEEIFIAFEVDNEGKFVLTVSDNGVGIPDVLDLRKAESLGMQLVSSLVDQLGATVEIDCSRGARFTITFTEMKGEEESI